MSENQKAYTKIDPKCSFYFPNGTGRDSYIHSNNGGFYKCSTTKAESTSGTFPRNSGSNTRNIALNIEPKVVHYHSDGSGRDLYIVTDLGGFAKTPNGINQQTFIKNLRTYSKMRSNSQKKPDYFDQAQKILRGRDLIADKLKVSRIKEVVNRLSESRIDDRSIRSSIERKKDKFLVDKSLDYSQILNKSLMY